MTAAVINGRWELALTDHRAEFHKARPAWEHERLASMHAHLKPGMTIVDVGAEEGDFPSLFASWGCRVAMIECKAEMWPSIRACWELNGFGTPAGLFVGFASDVTDLTPPRRYPPATGWEVQPDGWPLASLGPMTADPGFAVLAEQSDSIPQVTLDDFAAHLGLHLDAVTLDVEGAEARVLAGAERVLAEHRPLVWCSIHADTQWVTNLYDGANIDYIYKWMDERGYSGEWLGTGHEDHWLFSPRG